jgi:carbon starvation protein CstA
MMTDGMKARRREIERRKRAVAAGRLKEDEETTFRRRRLRTFTVWAILVLIAGWAYWRVQILHQNQWPLMDVWITMSIALLASFGWILWYFNRADL